jgi:hypothetical protein
MGAATPTKMPANKMADDTMTGQDWGSQHIGQEAAGSATASVSLRCHAAPALFVQIPELAEDMEARPQPGEPALTFALRLLNSPAPEEAVTFMAQLFTRRVAIWWGHECLRYLEPLLEAQDLEMMALCAAWVATPDDGHRQRVASEAEACATRSPGVWLALAAGWTGGSLAPANSPVVPPPRFLTGRGVNAAVLSALARGKREDRQATLATFLAMAQDLV